MLQLEVLALSTILFIALFCMDYQNDASNNTHIELVQYLIDIFIYDFFPFMIVIVYLLEFCFLCYGLIVDCIVNTTIRLLVRVSV